MVAGQVGVKVRRFEGGEGPFLVFFGFESRIRKGNKF